MFARLGKLDTLDLRFNLGIYRPQSRSVPDWRVGGRIYGGGPAIWRIKKPRRVSALIAG